VDIPACCLAREALGGQAAGTSWEKLAAEAGSERLIRSTALIQPCTFSA